MVGYLSETAFVGKLSFDIIMWIVILFITFIVLDATLQITTLTIEKETE